MDIEQILANAELVRKVAHEQLGINVGYDEAGVRWLDESINHQRSYATEAVKTQLPIALGSFLGECIRRTYGGEWYLSENGWGIKINEKLSAFPFNKVRKQLTNEDGDSVLGLFTTIPAFLALPPAINKPATQK